MSRMILFLSLLLFPLIAVANSGGPPDGFAGEPPNQRSCIQCHNSFDLNDGVGDLSLRGVPEEYVLEETYRLTVSMMFDSAEGRWGFEITALDENNNRAGTFELVDDDVTQISGDQAQYVKHTRAGTFQGQRFATWQFDWVAPEEDIGDVSFFVAGNAADGNGAAQGDYIYTISESSAPPEPLDEYELVLEQGWNLASSPVIPVDPDIRVIFEQLLEDGTLLRMSDDHGNFIDPQWGFWGFEEWFFYEAYNIHVSEDVTVVFTGRFVDPDHRYYLNVDWNWVPYSRLEDLHPLQAFELVEDIDLFWAKDQNERFYTPAFEFNGMGMIHPGNGIKIFVVEIEDDSAGSIIWPEPREFPEPPADPPALNHFEVERGNSPTSMSMLIAEWGDPYMPVAGHEVGVRNGDGLLVGASVVTGEGMLPIILWADDFSTDEIEGFSDDDELFFFYWDSLYDEEYPPRMVEPINQEDLVALSETFMAVRLTLPEPLIGVDEEPEAVPFDFSIVGVYPNPFNSSMAITFNLDRAGDVKLKVWNTAGNQVHEKNAGRLSPGIQTLTLNGESLATGLYIVGVEAGGRQALTRAVLIR